MLEQQHGPFCLFFLLDWKSVAVSGYIACIWTGHSALLLQSRSEYTEVVIWIDMLYQEISNEPFR
jgi:hypothetical protein